MTDRRFLLLFLVVFCLIVAACSALPSNLPLPTLAPTAGPVSSQGNPDQLAGVPPTFTAQPTRPTTTASATSPPTATVSATLEVDVFPTSTVPTVAPSATNTPVPQPTSAPATAVEFLPTSTPQPANTPVPPASPLPSNTPTSPPAPPTSTPTPNSFPLPPDVIWPSPTPHNQPLSNVPRHGVGISLGGATVGTYGSSPYSWTYAWTTFVPPVEKPVQHVPMLAGSPRSNLPSVGQIQLLDSYNSHNYWIVFNECEHQFQCNTSPAEAAQFFHDKVVDLLFTQGGDPDADIIIGGVNAHPCGILWLKNFVDYYQVTYGPLPYTGWHFHLYPEMRPSGWPNSCDGGWSFDDTLMPNVDAAFNLWRDHAANALAFVQEYGQPGDEIWFTEMGCLNYGFHQVQAPVCQAEGFMQDYASRILGWLNTDGRWVTRYAWFTNWTTRYFEVTYLIAEVPNDQPWKYSSLGYWYAQIVPASALPWWSQTEGSER